ncbi:MAG: ATP-dependent dethiobiotin synthetase BioD, partial [Thermodesulfobacteriota bacterium]
RLPLSEVCLYPLAAVLSPHLAARAEGVSIDPAHIRGAVVEAMRGAELVLVEGAGGATVEMCEGYSYLDLARDLSLPALVVAGNRLGVLNHLQLTLRCLRSEGIPLFGVILNDPAPEAFPAREPNETEARRIAGDAYLGRIPCGAAALPDELFSRFLRRLLSPPLNPILPGEGKE